jgi:N-acetylglutamate synthase-like GNAT family acetyltransferase
MTQEMLERARANAERLKAANVEFREGYLEALPVEDASVDVVISNCVINLSPDKPQVFREVFRVLRPGGRLAVSDIVTHGELPQAIQKSMQAWGACVAGALEVTDYVDGLLAAGFVEVAPQGVERMSQEAILRQAEQSDWSRIAALLQSAELTLDGAREHLDGFVVATRGESLLGCAALEHYHTTGRLRSVAVKSDERGTGIGRTLVQRILNRAREEGIQRVVLLTETAGDYFPKFGFRHIARDDVPAEALESVEFKTTHCASAAAMIVYL